MKKWTVMLIPHDRGERRNFNVSSVHVWALLCLLILTSFLSAFFFQRNRVNNANIQLLAVQYQELEDMMGSADFRDASDTFFAEREVRIRAEYDARDKKLTSELSRLYDLESEVRAMTGLPPHDTGDGAVETAEGGRGGSPADLGESVAFGDDALTRPPHIIYGMSSPSADLILQEITLRGESLDELHGAMIVQKDRIARNPSVWPSSEEGRYISSRFGNRKDPFTKRVRHHSGIDIVAPNKSPIAATARGTVAFSGRHKYLGELVKIDHGYGYESWYGHMSERLLEVGDVVERGDIIGRVGSTGRSTGPHIHYEVHVDGKRVDPKKYIGH